MRLFIAVELPPDVISELKRLQGNLDVFGLRPVKDFHLTLKFLGDVPVAKLERLKALLSEIEFSPFEAELSQAGAFPDLRYVKVIWAGLEGDGIYSLQKKVDVSLEQMGFGRDTRFKPHLTLARVNFIKDKDALAKKINGLSVKKLKFEVGEFRLIESTLTPKGPEYETKATFKAR